MEKEKPGQAVCPYDPHHNSTAIYVGKYRYTPGDFLTSAVN